MIKFVNDDIFTSGAHCLINTVNCEGFMGKGLAAQFKKRFPRNFEFYKEQCNKRQCSVGNVLMYEECGKIIANFPTKDKWRERSRYEFIESGLANLVWQIQKQNITSVSIPPLGCGNGGLERTKVEPMIRQVFDGLNVEVFLHDFLSYSNEVVVKFELTHLLLLKLKANLHTFNKINLQQAAFFMGLFAGADIFKHKMSKFGLYSKTIETVSDELKRYKEFSGLDDAMLEKRIFTTITSRNIDEKLAKFEPALTLACSVTNELSGDVLVVSTILDILNKSQNSLSDYEICSEFQKHSKQNVVDFGKIKQNLARAEELKLVGEDFFGYFSNLKSIKNTKH